MENKEKNIPKKKKAKMQLEKNERQKLLQYAKKYDLFIDETALLSGYFLDFWKMCLDCGAVITILETSMREMKRKAELAPSQYEEEYCKVVSALYYEFKEILPQERLFIIIKEDNGIEDLRIYNQTSNSKVLFITQDKEKMEWTESWAKEDEFAIKVMTLAPNGYLQEISVSEEDEENMLAALSNNELDNVDGNKKKLNHSWKSGI